MKHFPCDTEQTSTITQRNIIFLYENDFIFQDLEYIFQALKYKKLN